MHNVNRSYAFQQQDFFQAMGSPSLERGDSLDRCCDLARNLIQEEVNEETLPALRSYQNQPSLENFTHLADGIIDSVYVLLHAANSLGIPFDLVWDEVHRSNMAKLWEDGKARRREDGKILKPPGWTPPNIFEILKEYKGRKQMGDHYMDKGMVK